MASGEWTTEKAQASARAQGMCGESLPGDRICILEPGHGDHNQLDKLDEARRLTALAAATNNPGNTSGLPLTYLTLAIEALTDEVERLRELS